MATSPVYAFTVPGGTWGPTAILKMIQFGHEIRDKTLWQYPFLGEAVKTCIEIAATREWRLSGQERNIARTFEWLHNAATYNHDGIVEYGFEQFIKRLYMDNLCIGRQMFTWGIDGDPLRYLDPVYTNFYLQERKWVEHYTHEDFPLERVVVNHPIPFGSDGKFVSPVSLVVPSGMLMWLIREHDKASADGRKIRDIFIVKGEELATQLIESFQDVLAVWSGADPTKNGVNIVSYEDALGNVPASDVIHRIGLANIPENFNREGFTMEYINEISAALGLAQRHFYSGQENGTNRSLEEVQEARQQLKGPAAFIRTLQRQINQCGALKQFGKNIRFAFVEEVDTQTMLSRANVLKLYSDALSNFVDKLAGYVNIESLVAWLQADNILPADLEIITPAKNANQGNVIQESDQTPTPNKANNEIVRNSDEQPTTEKALPPLDYDEITIDQDGRVVERREKVFSFHKILEHKIREDLSDAMTEEAHTPKAFTDLLNESRLRHYEKFINAAMGSFEDDNERDEYNRLKALEKSALTERDYQSIQLLLQKAGATLWD